MKYPFPIENIHVQYAANINVFRIVFYIHGYNKLWLQLPAEALSSPAELAMKMHEAHNDILDEYVVTAPPKPDFQNMDFSKDAPVIPYMTDAKYLQYQYGLQKVKEARKFDWNLWVEDCWDDFSINTYNSELKSNSGLGNVVPKTLKSLLPGLSERTTCPQCQHAGTVEWAVMHLNDSHRLTREDIADWLDSLDINLSFNVKE